MFVYTALSSLNGASTSSPLDSTKVVAFGTSHKIFVYGKEKKREKMQINVDDVMFFSPLMPCSNKRMSLVNLS